MITLSYDRIKYYIYAYMGLTVPMFFIFYFKLYLIGIIFTLLLIGAFIWRIRGEKKEGIDKDGVKIKKPVLLIYLAASFVWTFLGGFGGHYAQSTDWNYRNAIFRDMLTRSWPVVYPEYDKMLNYYIGHWIQPAFFAKVIGKVFGLGENALWFIGNQFLWIYTAVGIFITMILLLCYVKTDSTKKQLLLMGLFVGFSGMDIVGTVLDLLFFHHVSYANIHIEWWSSFQFSSMTTCLFWVFNQTMTAWIVILCVVLEKKSDAFVFLGTCAALSGPLPFICIFLYMMVIAVKRVAEVKSVKIIKEFLSPLNILMVPPLLFIVRLYSSNAAINSTASESTITESSTQVMFARMIVYDPYVLMFVFLFLLLEAGIHLILLYKPYSRNALYWATALFLLLSPFFAMGNEKDFVMRFSVPAIMVLLMMCGKVLLGDKCEDTPEMKPILKKILIACIIIGMATPATEFARGYVQMLLTGRIDNVKDEVVTLDQDIYDNNFMTYGYTEDPFISRVL